MGALSLYDEDNLPASQGADDMTPEIRSRSRLIAVALVLAGFEALGCATASVPRGAANSHRRLSYHAKVDPAYPARIKVAIAHPCYQSGAQKFGVRHLNHGVVRGIDRYIANVEAVADGKPVAVKRSKLGTWEAETRSCRNIQLSYEVFLEHEAALVGDLRARGLRELPTIRENKAFLFGRMLFLSPERYPGDAVELEVAAPKGWCKIAPWPEVDGRFQVPKLRDVLDNYLVAGAYDLKQRESAGRRVTIAFEHAPGQKDADDKIIETIFGSAEATLTTMQAAPGTHHLFVVNRVDTGVLDASAMTNSVVLRVPRKWNPSLAEKLAVAVSHELLHRWTWELVPQEYSDVSWFIEGVPDYLSWKIVEKAKLAQKTEFLDEVQKKLGILERRRKKQLDRSLLQIGARFYSDGASQNLIYAAGFLIAQATDRSLTAQGKSLAELLRVLATRLGARPQFSLDDLLAEATAYGGSDTSTAWNKWLRSTPPPRAEGLLAGSGCSWVSTAVTRPSIGVQLAHLDDGFQVLEVSENSPADQVGVDVDDRIVQIGDAPIRAKEGFASQLAAQGKQRLTLLIERDGTRRQVAVEPEQTASTKQELSCQSGATPFPGE